MNLLSIEQCLDISKREGHSKTYLRQLLKNPYPPTLLRDLLELVAVPVSIPAIRSWSPLMRAKAASWATNTHLRASDNRSIRVPVRPFWLP